MTIDGTVLAAENLRGLAGVRHGFFTRQGGVSDGIYGSLNCGLGSSDDVARVVENRARVAAHLGAAPQNLATVHQTHSATALVIDRPFARDAVAKADALVTRTPGLVVAALAADCTPVLFADPEAGVVAAAHAGWRGAVGGILEATITTMERLGADRSRIRAAIGPCIGQPNYEVGPEFEAQFLTAAPGNARFFSTPPGKSRAHFDLPGFVGHRLAAAGLTDIERRSSCTYADEALFFSYRRTNHKGKSDYGRQISAIVVT
jgi:polyphenol oxidase